MREEIQSDSLPIMVVEITTAAMPPPILFRFQSRVECYHSITYCAVQEYRKGFIDDLYGTSSDHSESVLPVHTHDVGK